MSLFSRMRPHVDWEQAQRDLAAGNAVVFWKPGCAFCEFLLLRLRSEERVTWVNVWKDKDANAAVRAANNGDELTPTALIGDRVLRNPSAGEVIAALGKR